MRRQIIDLADIVVGLERLNVCKVHANVDFALNQQLFRAFSICSMHFWEIRSQIEKFSWLFYIKAYESVIFIYVFC